MYNGGNDKGTWRLTCEKPNSTYDGCGEWLFFVIIVYKLGSDGTKTKYKIKHTCCNSMKTYTV